MYITNAQLDRIEALTGITVRNASQAPDSVLEQLIAEVEERLDALEAGILGDPDALEALYDAQAYLLAEWDSRGPAN